MYLRVCVCICVCVYVCARAEVLYLYVSRWASLCVQKVALTFICVYLHTFSCAYSDILCILCVHISAVFMHVGSMFFFHVCMNIIITQVCLYMNTLCLYKNTNELSTRIPCLCEYDKYLCTVNILVDTLCPWIWQVFMHNWLLCVKINWARTSLLIIMCLLDISVNNHVFVGHHC